MLLMLEGILCKYKTLQLSLVDFPSRFSFLFLFSWREKSSQDSLRVCSLISLVLSPRIPYKISHNSPMLLYLCIKTSSPEIHFVMLFDVFLLPSSPYSFGSTTATAIFPMQASSPSLML